MKINKIIIAFGLVGLVFGVASRLLMFPLPPAGIEASALVQFASSCFLLSIALSLLKCSK